MVHFLKAWISVDNFPRNSLLVVELHEFGRSGHGRLQTNPSNGLSKRFQDSTSVAIWTVLAALRASAKDGTMYCLHWWGSNTAKQLSTFFYCHFDVFWPFWLFYVSFEYAFACFLKSTGPGSDWCSSCSFERSSEIRGWQPGGSGNVSMSTWQSHRMP